MKYSQLSRANPRIVKQKNNRLSAAGQIFSKLYIDERGGDNAFRGFNKYQGKIHIRFFVIVCNRSIENGWSLPELEECNLQLCENYNTKPLVSIIVQAKSWWKLSWTGRNPSWGTDCSSYLFKAARCRIKRIFYLRFVTINYHVFIDFKRKGIDKEWYLSLRTTMLV